MKQKRLNYTTDDNINNLALIIIEKINKLKPDYLEIEDLANEIIKYAKQEMKYNDNN